MSPLAREDSVSEECLAIRVDGTTEIKLKQDLLFAGRLVELEAVT